MVTLHKKAIENKILKMHKHILTKNFVTTKDNFTAKTKKSYTN
jgi:hypothetical protein